MCLLPRAVSVTIRVMCMLPRHHAEPGTLGSYYAGSAHEWNAVPAGASQQNWTRFCVEGYCSASAGIELSGIVID